MNALSSSILSGIANSVFPVSNSIQRIVVANMDDAARRKGVSINPPAGGYA
jgi:hypothetical protein